MTVKNFPNGATGLWIRFALNVLVLPVVILVLLNAKSIAVIEANRWTSADQGREKDRQNDEISAMWKAINNLPPDAFEEKVDRLIREMADLREVVGRIDERTKKDR